MTDVEFAEAEGESFNPQVTFRPNQVDKQPSLAVDEAEVAPLLGAPVLAEDDSDKRWYNTPSVRIPVHQRADSSRYFGCCLHFS
jgi:hypothetical protein